MVEDRDWTRFGWLETGVKGGPRRAERSGTRLSFREEEGEGKDGEPEGKGEDGGRGSWDGRRRCRVG